MTDREQLLALYGVCFPEDGPDFWSWIFDRIWQPGNTLCVREGGRIVSSLQMLPCELRLGEKCFAAHYIYAAATMPQWQGRGLMAGLLARAAEEGRARGQDFSVLITQEDSLLDYYARFGYAPRLELGLGQPEADGGTGRVRVAGPEDIPALNALYEQAAERLLHGARDEHHWRLQLELFGEGARVLEGEDGPSAYAFADERGILEAVGPSAGALAARLQPGKPWRTLPGAEARPMGSIKPLNDRAQAALEQNRCFLNLMFN